MMFVPVNMPDPIRKRFGYSQLWALRPACSQNRPGSCMPGPTSRILLSSVFPKMTDRRTIQYNFIAKCQYTDCTRNVLWCQVHSSHIYSKLKHLITTTANKHHCKKSFTDKNMKNPTGIKLCISHKIATSRGPHLKSYCPNKSNYKN